MGSHYQNLFRLGALAHLTQLEHFLTSCDKSITNSMAIPHWQEASDPFGHAEHHVVHANHLLSSSEASSAATSDKQQSGRTIRPTLFTGTSTNLFFTRNDICNDRPYSDGLVSPGAAMSNGQFISMLPGQLKSTSSNLFFKYPPDQLIYASYPTIASDQQHPGGPVSSTYPRQQTCSLHDHVYSNTAPF